MRNPFSTHCKLMPGEDKFGESCPTPLSASCQGLHTGLRRKATSAKRVAPNDNERNTRSAQFSHL